MPDKNTLRDNLRSAELKLAGRSRIIVDGAVAQLSMIIREFPQSEEAGKARELLRRYGYSECPAGVAEVPLNAREVKIIETIDGAASWDVPALIEIESQIPAEPTAAFPAELANSLRRFLDHVESMPAKNCRNVQRFYYVIAAVAKRQRYKDVLDAPTDRMAALIKAVIDGNFTR